MWDIRGYIVPILYGGMMGIIIYKLNSKTLFLKAVLERKVSIYEKILSICSNCKKIRDNQDNWIEIEDFFTKAKFTHGLCEKCVKELYPDLNL